MVLAPEYSDKKKEGKYTIEKVWIQWNFPYLTEQEEFQVFQLHRMIFRIGQDYPVYGRLSMVPVVTSLNLLHYII